MNEFMTTAPSERNKYDLTTCVRTCHVKWWMVNQFPLTLFVFFSLYNMFTLSYYPCLLFILHCCKDGLVVKRFSRHILLCRMLWKHFCVVLKLLFWICAFHKYRRTRVFLVRELLYSKHIKRIRRPCFGLTQLIYFNKNLI